MMTKKDYELIAATIAGTRLTSTQGYTYTEARTHDATLNTFAERIADALATTSPKFDRERFLRACRPESVRGSK